MARILISPLGTGIKKENQNVYKKTKYKIEDKFYNESFISIALTKHFDIDKQFLIGTSSSMWDEAYLQYSYYNKREPDEEFWADLSESIKDRDHKFRLGEDKIKKVRSALGEESEIYIINYGLDQDEIMGNFNILFDISSKLNDGDEIYIDITHSFRSLSLFVFVITNYIKNVMDRDIKINGLHYGMFEAPKELGYTPVVNLNLITQMMEYIKGISEFKNYGNGYILSSLISDQNVNKKIKTISEVVNLGNLTMMRKSINDLKGVVPILKNSNFIGDSITAEALEKFVKRFSNAKTDSKFQYETAKWFFENKRYGQSYMVLTEAVVSYICEKEYMRTISKEDRDAAKGILFDCKSLSEGYGNIGEEEFIRSLKNKDESKRYKKIAKYYFEINDIRNRIAHAVDHPNSRTNLKGDIDILQKSIEAFKNLLE
ncbi:TIGR02221 family CRISPR-associated protein [uncultured Ilyobacter sp.]|uniref:TIGR02221 family CRISPR-associated protein n=1 Tax=uncultured Ilyobacter sp. TaxID=544433 RepID=UPI0029C66582|nr:TIGR02221 family CRISPR-associated protein [uncultured Ilyobacter sp.]